MILVISGSVILLKDRNSRQARVSGREPLPRLSYCSSTQNTPCILSFNLKPDGNMVINILADSSSIPDFYMKIRHNESESIFECQKVKGFSTSVACLGRAMPPGEPLQFLVVSRNEDVLLAEGSFPIIGLAVATPEVAPTPTPYVPFNPHYE